MRLVELEISRHDWGLITCGCGRPAEYVADTLRRVASDGGAVDWTDGHVADSAPLYAPAGPAAAVALAALAGELSADARLSFLTLLHVLVAGEGTSFDAAATGRDLPEECLEIASGGLWLLYSEVFAPTSPAVLFTAYELVSLIDPDTERVAKVYELRKGDIGYVPG